MPEERVVFKAIADFSRLRREARSAKRELEQLRRESLKGNADLTASGRQQEAQANKTARSLGELSRKHKDSATAAKEHGTATRGVATELGNLSYGHQRASLAANQQTTSTRALADAEDDLARANLRQRQAVNENISARRDLDRLIRSNTASEDDLTRASERAARAQRNLASSNDELNIATRTTIVRQRELGNESRTAGGSIIDLFGKLGTLRGGFRALGGALKLLALPAIVQGLQTLAAAATYAAGALVALASSIGPLIGLLGAIPGAAIGAASAIGTLALGFRGIFDAIKAGGKANRGAGAAAKKSGDQQAQSAKRAADAQRNLARAHRDAARQIEQAQRGVADALRGVADAERNLARAQAQARDAQEDLNRARQEALEDLEDMERAVRRANLSEERATIALEEARERLDELNRARDEGARAAADLSGYTDDEIAAMREAGVTFEETAEERRNLDRERRSAALAVRDAELDLAEAQDRVGDTQRDLTRQFAGGIETSDRVVQAREALASANEGVADAQRSLADAFRGVEDAQRALAEAHESAAERIADAQRAVAEAFEKTADAAAAGGGGIDAFAEAMAKLSPAGRSFVRFVLNEVLPAFRRLSHEIQEVLLPRLERAGRTLLSLIPTITPSLKLMAAALGDIAIAGANMVTSGPWRADIQTLMGDAARHMRTLGAVALLFADGLRHVAIAARPLLDALGEISLRLAAQFQAWAQAGRESGRLEAFFRRVAWVTEQILALFGNLIGILMNVGRAARDVGDNYLKRLVDWTEKWQQKTAEGTTTFDKMRQFFEDTKPALQAVIDLFAAFIKGFADLVKQVRGETGEFPFVENLRKFSQETLPALIRFIGSLDQTILPAILNLITALANLGTTLGPLSGAISAFAQTFADIIGVFDWLLRNVPFLKELLAGLLVTIGSYKAVQLTGAIVGLFVGSLKDLMGVTRLISPLMSSTAATTVAGWIAMAATAVAKAAVIAASWLVAFAPIALVIAAVAALVVLLVVYWDEIKAGVAAAWNWVKTKTEALWNWMPDWLKNVLRTVLAVITGGLSEAVLAVTRNWEEIKRRTSAFIDRFKQIVSDGIEKVVGWFKESPQRITMAFTNLPGLLADIGADLIRGLWDGISRLGGWLYEKVSSFVRNNIIDPAKRLLGWSSPAKLFIRMGQDIVRGTQKGIEDFAPQLARTSLNLVHAVTAGIDLSGASSQVMGAFAPSIRVDLSGVAFRNGVGPEEVGDVIGERIEAAVERIIRSGRQGRK